jgi:hypothetical protein
MVMEEWQLERNVPFRSLKTFRLVLEGSLTKEEHDTTWLSGVDGSTIGSHMGKSYLGSSGVIIASLVMIYIRPFEIQQLLPANRLISHCLSDRLQ